MLILVLWFVFYILKSPPHLFFFFNELVDKFPSCYVGALQNLGDLMENFPQIVVLGNDPLEVEGQIPFSFITG